MRGDGRPSHNLPLRLTSFVGRERVLAEVQALLHEHRLVTLVGAPGVGKTRLGLHVAATLLNAYPDGAWLVELAPLSDPALVPQAVADVLGVREQPGRALAASLAEHLHRRGLLLLLDNCEHLVGAVATLAEALLRTCPDLRILATSREPLAIEGEATWRVPSLAFPDLPRAHATLPARALAEYEAVRLFVERARVAMSAFALDQQNAPTVAQICARLDGIPLAIELAAARVRALSVEQIAARLDDRFRLLTGGSRTALPRQQTLRGAVDWSYDLLAKPEQALLRRLAVFAGGFTLEAAERVASSESRVASGTDDDSLLITRYALLDLVDKSLVQVEPGGDGERRYRLLETLRQYGLEKLAEHGELAAARDRHRDYFLALAREAEPRLTGPEQIVALRELEREHDNFRAALAWCFPAATPPGEAAAPETDPEGGMQLVVALIWLWVMHAHLSEGRRWLEQALAVPPADRTPARLAARVKALRGTAQLAAYQGDFRLAVVLLEEALALSRQTGDDQNVVFAARFLGMYLSLRGEHERAARLCEESLALARKLGVDWLVGRGLVGMATLAIRHGQYQRAVELSEERLVLARQEKISLGLAYGLRCLSRAVCGLGDHARAWALAEESLSISREMGDQRGVAEAYKDLGGAALVAGDVGQAIAHLRQALLDYHEPGDPWGVVQCLHRLISALTLQGVHLAERERAADATAAFIAAARLLGANEALRESIGVVLLPTFEDAQEHDLATLRQYLGEDALSRTWSEDRGLSLDQTVEYALTITATPTQPASGEAATPSSPAETNERRSDPERTPDVVPLSPREQEVAALVARGLTNRQIGERLTLSERTVDTHVRNIMGKLAVNSRAQIAAWAVEHHIQVSSAWDR
jgi:non-specific serine/threonine protein kinase